jgi:hypothetical protein
MQCTNDTDRPDMDNKNRGSVRADSSQHWNLMGLSSTEDSSWLQKTVLWSSCVTSHRKPSEFEIMKPLTSCWIVCSNQQPLQSNALPLLTKYFHPSTTPLCKKVALLNLENVIINNAYYDILFHVTRTWFNMILT